MACATRARPPPNSSATHSPHRRDQQKTPPCVPDALLRACAARVSITTCQASPPDAGVELHATAAAPCSSAALTRPPTAGRRDCSPRSGIVAMAVSSWRAARVRGRRGGGRRCSRLAWEFEAGGVSLGRRSVAGVACRAARFVRATARARVRGREGGARADHGHLARCVSTEVAEELWQKTRSGPIVARRVSDVIFRPSAASQTISEEVDSKGVVAWINDYFREHKIKLLRRDITSTRRRRMSPGARNAARSWRSAPPSLRPQDAEEVGRVNREWAAWADRTATASHPHGRGECGWWARPADSNIRSSAKTDLSRGSNPRPRSGRPA